MTCTLNQPHILSAIDESMEPSDISDIIVRFFKQHVTKLVEMLFNGDIPRQEKSIRKIYVIEFENVVYLMYIY